jgi:hypothetical protein
LQRAETAIALLIDNGNFIPATKEQFALMAGFIQPGPNGHDIAQRQWVEDVCNATRDHPQHFGGFVICYSPSDGGMVLIDPDGSMSMWAMIKLINGDMRTQHACQTMMRRRLPTWNAFGRQLAQQGDVDGSRLAFQAEGELDQHGIVTETTWIALAKHLLARGLLETPGV